MTGSKVGERGGHGRERSSGRDLNMGCPKRNGAAYRRAAHKAIGADYIIYYFNNFLSGGPSPK